MVRRGMRWAIAFLIATVCLFAPWRSGECRAAVDLAAELRRVASDDSEQAALALDRLKTAADPAVLPALQALDAGALVVDAAGNTFIKGPSGLKPALSGGPAAPVGT